MSELQVRVARRAAVIDAVRAFFRTQGFWEVDTPVALSTVAPEPHLDAPVTDLGCPAHPCPRFLQTSPELPMKRLLAAGLDRIFQIAPVFRAGDLSPLHRPEFRMLEWYRRGATWQDLLADCEGLLAACARAAARPLRFESRGVAVDLSGPFRRMSVEQAFRVHAGFSILDALAEPVLRDRLDRAGVPVGPDDDWDDLFHRIFLTCVEPQLRKEPGPLFLTHYPAPLSSLARLSPEDPRTAERFELLIGDLELANGFGELVDAAEQRARFTRDRQRRLTAGLQDYPPDERFLQALSDLPPSAGIAMGLERLLMVVLGVEDMDSVCCIPWSET